VQARVWHRTQEIDRTTDGGIRISLPVANFEPLVSWILEWDLTHVPSSHPS
jgi:hypothetical protein